MTKHAKWLAAKRVQQPLRSPGRPPVGRREDRVRFWAAIACGQYPEMAVQEARVSWVVGSRWFRHSGGMPPTHLAPSAPPLSGRYLSFAEREELALLHIQGLGVRECARRLGRAPATISRELRRNAARRGGHLEYKASTAQWHADRAAQRPKAAKLAVNPTPAAVCTRPLGRRDHHAWGRRLHEPSVCRPTIRGAPVSHRLTSTRRNSRSSRTCRARTAEPGHAAIVYRTTSGSSRHTSRRSFFPGARA